MSPQDGQRFGMQTPRRQERQGRAPIVMPQAAQLMALDSWERIRATCNGPGRSVAAADPDPDRPVWSWTRWSSKTLATGMVPCFLGVAWAVPAERSRSSAAPHGVGP
jgi:hypothetical protein